MFIWKNKTMPRHPANRLEAGFSLIEISIVLIIIGILMTGILQFQKIQMTGKTFGSTRANIAEVNKAVSVYISRNSRLPCPSSLIAKPDEEAYGSAPDCKEMLASPSLTTDKAHLLVDGRNDGKILIGKIPFREMNITEASTKDGWGRDLYYAVSANLTDMEKYDQFKGVIDVVDAYDRSLTEINTGAQYVIFSTGQDRLTPDDDACDKERADGENCNGDGKFRVAELSFGQNKEFYDDVVSYIVWVPPPANVAGQCNMLHQLLSYPSIQLSDITAALGEDHALSLYPGEMTFLCNRRLLRKMGMKSCVLFNCRSDNVLQIVETIN